jgi:hypothetical protein
MARQVDVRQRRCRERAAGIPGQAAIAHLGKTPQSLDHCKHMLDARTLVKSFACGDFSRINAF